MDIKGGAVIVTGSATGVGAAAAKMLAGKDRITATRSIDETVPLSAVDTGAAVAATDTAFGKAMRQLVPWVVQHTAAHKP